MNKLVVIAAGILAATPVVAHAAANPASVFCGKMGGRTVIAKLADGGDIGLCYLPRNRIVEEWTLFRMFDGKRPTPRNNPFR